MRNFSAAVIVAVLSQAAAAAPLGDAFNLQGHLRNLAGDPVNGDWTLAINFYDAGTGGSKLWTYDADVVVDGGVFAVRISGWPATLLTGPRWVGVKIQGEPELPRVAVDPVPYAFAAERAQTAEHAAHAETASSALEASHAAAADTAASADVAEVASGLACTACLTSAHFAVGTFSQVAFTGQYADLSNRPTLHAVATSGLYSDLIGGPDLTGLAHLAGGNTFSGLQTLSGGLKLGANADFAGNQALLFRFQNAEADPRPCDAASAGMAWFQPSLRRLWLCDGVAWASVYDVAKFGTVLKPGLSCRHILQQGASSGDGTYYVDPDGAGTQYGAKQVQCDMTGGGWTLVFSNLLTANLNGITFTRAGSQCGNAIHTNTVNGWWFGHGNAGNTLSVADMGNVEWTWTLSDPAAILDATEIRHSGIVQNHSDYDYPGTTELIAASPFKADGELGAQLYDGSTWSWVAHYKADSGTSKPFELKRTQTVRPPYMRWGFQHGGPSDCDTANSDGGYLRNFEVWVR